MNQDRDKAIERLAELAESGQELGRNDASADQHRLDQMKSILRLASMGEERAPSELVQRAKGLMPVRRRTFLAEVLKSNLVMSGARSMPETAQLLVGDDECSIRLAVRRIGTQYELLGELPGEEWSVISGGTVEQQGRRFRMVAELTNSAFAVENDEVSMQIPGLEDLLSLGSHDPD